MEFENLIYVFLTIGYLLYTFLSGRNKKKRKQQRTKPVNKAPRREPQATSIEEMIRKAMEGDKPAEKEEVQAPFDAPPVIPVTEQPEKAFEPFVERPEVVEKPAPELDILDIPGALEILPAEPESKPHDFDLRQAVIHSIILERPYR